MTTQAQAQWSLQPYSSNHPPEMSYHPALSHEQVHPHQHPPQGRWVDYYPSRPPFGQDPNPHSHQQSRELRHPQHPHLQPQYQLHHAEERGPFDDAFEPEAHDLVEDARHGSMETHPPHSGSEAPTHSECGRERRKISGMQAGLSQPLPVLLPTSELSSGSGSGSRSIAKRRGRPTKTVAAGAVSKRSRSSSTTGPLPPGVQPTEELMGSTTTAIFLPDPYQPHIQLKGVSKSGLLPAPPGCILDVNDLLILHPPARETQGLGHTSQYEMYTCRVCSKTYDGKNARSVARRHLQDKHGVPLSVQKRRSRWDYEPDRPKNKKDAKERSLKCKRDWASKNRQINKLEKFQAPFLERFGPNGIMTPGGVRLVAPKFKGAVTASMRGARYLDGTSGNLIIPEDILNALNEINESENTHGSAVDRIRSGFEEGVEENMLELGLEVTVDMNQATAKIKKGKAGGNGKGKGRTASAGALTRIASRTEGSTSSNTPYNTQSSGSLSPVQYLPDPSNDFAASRSSVRGETSQIPHNPQVPFGWQNGDFLQPMSMQLVNGQFQFTYPHGFQTQDVQYYDYQNDDENMDHDSDEQEEEMNGPNQLIPIDQESVLSTPEPMQEMPQQRWVPTQHWQTVYEEPQGQLEPAMDIAEQWQGLQLNGWRSSEGEDDTHEDDATLQAIKEGSVETVGEAVAAESLLNLHSTPLRGPDENGRNDVQLLQARGSIASKAERESESEPENEPQSIALARPSLSLSQPTRHARVSSGWSEKIQLLDAPAIMTPSLTRPTRARSFIQPFRDPRPEVTQSLSFDHQPTLDDPFVLAQTPIRPSSANKPTPGSSFRRSNRHTISMPSPSPHSSSSTLTLISSGAASASYLKKRKDAPTSPATLASGRTPKGSMTHARTIKRSALKPLSTNLNLRSYGSGLDSSLGSAGGGSGGVKGDGGSGGSGGGSGGSFATPIRPNQSTIPSSLTREWLQLSSPGNTDAAASLGLVPTHLAPSTPGLRGAIGAETPETTILEARAKKRRSETPKFGFGAGSAAGLGVASKRV